MNYPPIWKGFIPIFVASSAISSLFPCYSRVFSSDRGHVAVSVHDGHDIQKRIATTFAHYPELHHPDRFDDLHVTLGYLNAPGESLTDAEMGFLSEGFGEIENLPIGEMLVDKVWLVHYANRTLNRILGRCHSCSGN